MTLSDGQSFRSGGYGKFNDSFEMPASSKIYKIEIIAHCPAKVGQVILYDRNGLLKKIGDDCKGTKETFYISENEQLIGCESDYSEERCIEVKFLKWRH